jgi:hypothetical protein
MLLTVSWKGMYPYGVLGEGRKVAIKPTPLREHQVMVGHL